MTDNDQQDEQQPDDNIVTDEPAPQQDIASTEPEPQAAAPAETIEDPAESSSELEAFRSGAPDYNVGVLDAAVAGGRRDVSRYVDSLDQIVADMPGDKRSPRLSEFKETYEKSRVLKTGLLTESITHGDLDGAAKPVRSAIWRVIKSLPRS